MKKALFTIMVVAALIVPSAAAAYVGCGKLCYDPNNKVCWFVPFVPIEPDSLAYVLENYGEFASGDTVIVTAPGNLADACPIEYCGRVIGRQVSDNTISVNQGFDFGSGVAFEAYGDCSGIKFISDRDVIVYMIMAVTDPDPFSGVWECINVIGHFRACPKLCNNCIEAERVTSCGNSGPSTHWGEVRPMYR